MEGEGRLAATTGREGLDPAGRSSALAGRAGVVDAFVALLVRALDLDRVLLLLEEGPGGPLRCVGSSGPVPTDPVAPRAVPPGGPWSATFPFETGGRPSGLLLLGRPDGAPLDAKDYAFARPL